MSILIQAGRRMQGRIAECREVIGSQRACAMVTSIAASAPKRWEDVMCRYPGYLTALFMSAILAATGPAISAEVTAERLINVDREPQNWLTNHRTYDAQRYSPLDRINKENAKNLKLAYAVALGGTSVNMNLESTPLAEDGFLYVVDQWGVLYKIDGRSGDAGRIIWRMDPNQEKLPLANRGAALWGNFVISTANYP